MGHEQNSAKAFDSYLQGLRPARYDSLSEWRVMLITSSCNVLCNGRLTNLRLYGDGAFKVTVL